MLWHYEGERWGEVVVAACVVCYRVSAVASSYLNWFITLMYLDSVLAISRHPN